jgi:uncharacterized protein
VDRTGRTLLVCVLAKEPRPGFVKTRLCPPCSPEEAAALAEASLVDTLAAVAATPSARLLVVLDGRPGAWLPAGTEVVPQVGGGLGARLDGAVTEGFARHPGGPVVVIGMDTPQVGPGHLRAVARPLSAVDGQDGADAVVAPATDGGYWAIGLRRPVPGAFDGVPMSTTTTGAAQRRRLVQLGCRVATAVPLTDVDDVASARAVAASAPTTVFARTWRRLPGAGRP